MWKLNRIIAENILAFKELDYTLTQGVSTLIFGDNRDNESQRSNGSGKSALLECIAIGITGSPLRKVKNEEIINDSADDCYVQLELNNSSSNEVFVVERNIYRKGASLVKCTIFRDGKEIETDEAVQHSVDAYNKYILEKIGITREELFNNFLLSKHKYEEFLSVSDKQKKEIINRFSNGIVVDDAIAKIEVDIEPIQNELHSAELEFAGIEGRIEMLSEQIEAEENSKVEKAQNKKIRIESIMQNIADKRYEIRNKEQYIASLSETKTKIEACDKRVQKIEHSDASIDKVLEQVKFELSQYGTLSDWMKIIAQKKDAIENLTLEIVKMDERVASTKQCAESEQKEFEKLNAEYEKFTLSSTVQKKQYEKELDAVIDLLEIESKHFTQLDKSQNSIQQSYNILQNKLAGTITCPNCSHEFILSIDFDVADGKEQVKKLENELSSVKSSIAALEIKVADIEKQEKEIVTKQRQQLKDENEWLEKMSKAKRNIQVTIDAIVQIDRKSKDLKEKLLTLNQESDNIRRKIFDEAFDLIDRTLSANEKEVKKCREDIAALNSSIEILQNTKKEIENSSPDEVLLRLKASLKEYRAKSTEGLHKIGDIKNRLSRLTEQQQRFMEFKSFIANTKIEALSKITNEFLESIGSDIRINFSGYTKLKTGKIREKISVSLVRDGIDMGSFGKFSEGEKARVNLATILSMQKLVNSNCDDDKGLDLLVLDEILAAVDEEGHAMMFESLNKLGITALVVSHGNISESYPHTLIIQKQNGKSEIQ